MWDKIAARNIGLPMCRTVREQEEAFATSSRLISLELPSPDAVKVARNSRTLVPNSTIDGNGFRNCVDVNFRYYALLRSGESKNGEERQREKEREKGR